MDLPQLIDKLLLPLLRLCLTMCAGLFLASLLEGLHWTRFVARLASPLARLGHLREVSAASFALAFFSPAAANSLLAEAHARGELSRREAVFANLFNSSPTYLVHLPTQLSMCFAFLGPTAFIYVGLTFLAASLRTLATVLAGRLLLPTPPAEPPYRARQDKSQGFWRDTLRLTYKRFRKRIGKLLLFTIPIYCLFFAAQRTGFFSAVEDWLAAHAAWLSFLNPQSLSIVALHLLADAGAALSAAASLAHSAALTPPEIVMALLAGNIVSSPMRAVRHQFPSYAGIYTPSLALFLVLASQICRIASLSLVAALYYWYAF